ncbi:MAG: ABC transporter substrate-binding protein [Planctomyces sp.]
MQNRFGIKDFVSLVMLAIVALLVILSGLQIDRAWQQNTIMLERIRSLEGQVGRLDNSLAAVAASIAENTRVVERLGSQPRVMVVPSGSDQANASGATAGTSASATKSAPTSADSWARPGVEILRQPPLGLASDPRKQPGFQDGGEITEIWEAQTKQITPFISTDVYSRRVQELTNESLATLNPRTLRTEGLLAEAWQVDPEGTWLRARLREGVRFSDGKPITAEDFRWTFHEYIMNEQIEAERTRSILRDSIERVEAIDDRTVEFTFRKRLFTNVDNALGMFVLPKHFYSQFTPAQINRSSGLLMGSGPFRLRDLSVDKQWAPPEDIVLERNEQYWGPRPALASLRYKAVNEEIGRLNSFFAGNAEIITPSAPQFVSKSEDPEWQVITRFNKWVNMRSGYSFIAWNCGERNGKLTKFSDKRVRQAMTHALDREKMIRDIWKGIGVVAKGNQPIDGPGSNPDIKPWPFDQARARELLKSAGWEDRNNDGVLENELGEKFQFEYTYAGGSEISDRVARFVKDSFQAIGIVVEPRSVDWSVYQDLLKQRDFDAITLGWGANAPESDPMQIFHSSSIKNQGDNFAQWSNAEADRLIDAGRAELDPDKRAAIWRQLEAVLHDEQPYTFVRVPPWTRFVRREVGNVVMYPKGLEPAEYFRAGASTPKPAN